MDKQTNEQINEGIDSWKDGKIVGQMDRCWIDGQIVRQMDRYFDRQIDSRIDRQ